jgi:hypothetical protein
MFNAKNDETDWDLGQRAASPSSSKDRTNTDADIPQTVAILCHFEK